ncbi:MAG: helix-turn-helix transcriptional regulator [Bacteroidota bacterium]
MTFTIIISVISSIGLGLSLFFGMYLLKSKKYQNRILSILLIVFSLRITKSVFYNFIDLPLYIKNLGLAANLATGPLLYFYGRALFRSSGIFPKFYWVHFIPTLCYIVFCNAIPNAVEHNTWPWSYGFVLVQSFFYVFLSLMLYRNNAEHPEKELRKWFLVLTGTLAAIWLVYALIFIKVLPMYSAGPIAFSIFMFALTSLAVNRRKVFEEKYINAKISLHEGRSYLQKLERLLEEEQLYRDATLTLDLISKRLNLPARDVSLVINRHARQNFSSFINAYRIEAAKKRLRTGDKHTKIVEIAMDSGFNTLSSFNVAFKATTRQTPSEYRLKYRTDTMN